MGAIAGILPRIHCFARGDLTAALTIASNAMSLRAPVEGGMAVASDGSIGLAHRAGYGAGGESVLQPLTNESGRLWLVADGEPSNAPELRLELVGAGHRFRSTSGSEVILHLYEQDGVRALGRLGGGFAFALWDPEHRELLIGRDRFGEKPLYVADGPERLSFASEVQALDRVPSLARTALAFLTLGYLPEPLCASPAVQAVTPGSVLRVRSNRVWSECFWSERIWDEASLRPRGARDADRVHLGCLVRETVQAAVRGEQDVGILLDGGIGSVGLLALVRPVLGRGLRTHALVFDSGAPRSGVASRARDPVAVEAGKRALAAWFRSEHCEHRIGPAEVAAAFFAAAVADQPSVNRGFARVAAARMRASGDRLVLSALGAPELFGLQRDALSAWFWRTLCHGSARAAVRAAARVAARFDPFGRAAALDGYLARPGSIAAMYLATRGLFAPQALSRLLRAETLAQALAHLDPVAHLDEVALRVPGPRCPLPPRSVGDATGRLLSGLERGARLTSADLRDAESAAAAHGLSLAAPYLDHRLFEWVAAVDGEHPIAGSQMLADVLAAAVPVTLRRWFRRPALAPPSQPLGCWMRAELRPLIEEQLFAEDPEGLFNSAGITQLWQLFLAGRGDPSQLWALATLRAWIAARRERARAVSTAAGRSHVSRNAA